jgi:hypothetical protein
MKNAHRRALRALPALGLAVSLTLPTIAAADTSDPSGTTPNTPSTSATTTNPSTPATSSVPAASREGDKTEQIDTLKKALEILRRRNAIQQHDIDILNARLQSLTGSSSGATASSAVQTEQTQSQQTIAPAAVVEPPGDQQQQGSPKLKSAPTDSSVNTVYQQQNALFHHGITITPSFYQGYTNGRFFTLNGFMALGAIFLGNINVSQQKNNVATFDLNGTYGLTSRLQLSLDVPMQYRTAQYTTFGAQNSSALPSQKSVDYTNLGDISLGAFYNVQQEHGTKPSVIANMQLTVPTGMSPYGIKLSNPDPGNSNLQYPLGLPTGQGVYALSSGVTFVKTLDPAIVFGGLNYYHNFARRFKDISPFADEIQPGAAQPGDSFSFNFGSAFALNDRLSTSLSYQEIITRTSRLRNAGGPWSPVVGSNATAGILNFGTSYSINKHLSWQAMIGVGVTPDAPNVSLQIRFPHQL